MKKLLFTLIICINYIYAIGQVPEDVIPDTLPLRKKIQVLKNPYASFPTLKSPSLLCDSIQLAWQILVKSKKIRNYIPDFNDTNTYYAGFNIQINAFGKVSELRLDKISIPIERAFYTSSQSLLVRSTWKPANKISKKKNEKIKTDNIISFMIRGDQVILFNITELKTGYQIIKCKR